MKKESYLSVYRAVYSRPWLATSLEVLSLTVTALTVLVYSCTLAYMAVLVDALLALKYLAVTAIPFLLVTLVRHIINAPRPYEVFDCEYLLPLRERGRGAHSFPSRHVASSMIIGASLTFVCPWVGALLMILGIALGACRVLLGRHFLRDVLAGGVIGAISGVVGMLIVNI